MRKAEAAAAIIIIAACLLIFYASREYPTVELEMGGSIAFYPNLIAGAFAGVALLLFLGSILGSRSREKTSSFILPEKRRGLPLLLTLLLLLATPYIMAILGFLLTIFIFLTVLLLSLRGKPLTLRWVLATMPLSAGVTGSVYALFWWVARVPLPIGTLFGG